MKSLFLILFILLIADPTEAGVNFAMNSKIHIPHFTSIQQAEEYGRENKKDDSVYYALLDEWENLYEESLLNREGRGINTIKFQQLSFVQVALEVMKDEAMVYEKAANELRRINLNGHDKDLEILISIPKITNVRQMVFYSIYLQGKPHQIPIVKEEIQKLRTKADQLMTSNTQEYKRLHNQADHLLNAVRIAESQPQTLPDPPYTPSMMRQSTYQYFAKGLRELFQDIELLVVTNISDQAMIIPFPKFKSKEEAKKFGKNIRYDNVMIMILYNAYKRLDDIIYEKIVEESNVSDLIIQKRLYEESLKSAGWKPGNCFYAGSIPIKR